jgi:hypothetical protein
LGSAAARSWGLAYQTPLVGDVRMNRVVTSFNEEGYKRYGAEFIETYLKFWPKSVGLTVYYEGDDFPFTGGLSWRPYEEVEFLSDYEKSLCFPIMHGIVGDRYDINYDARQGRSAFIASHAMKHYGGKIFWIDADTVTRAPVPDTLLDDLLSDEAFCCYLGRDGWYFTEVGFIGFNNNHPIAGKFRKNWVNLYRSGTIFAQAPQYDDKGQYIGGGWHDSHGFDCVRKVLGNGPEFVNLAAHLPFGTMHPAVNTILGKYMWHLKGDRKDTKQLREGDLIVT